MVQNLGTGLSAGGVGPERSHHETGNPFPVFLGRYPDPVATEHQPQNVALVTLKLRIVRQHVGRRPVLSDDVLGRRLGGREPALQRIEDALGTWRHALNQPISHFGGPP